MTETPIETVTVDERHIAGFASTIEAAPELDDSELRGRLETVAEQLGTALPGDQSMATDLYRRMADRVRGIRLVEDLGEHTVELPWVCLHIPRDGAARLQWTGTQSGSSGFRFSVVGNGLGDALTYSGEQRGDLQERIRCTAVVEQMRVHVRSYGNHEQPGDLVHRTDVVARTGTIVRELVRCPLCEPSAADELVLTEPAGEAVDLVSDPVGIKTSEQVTLSGVSELEIGLKAALPGDLGVSAGVTCKREVSFSCTVEYTFRGGRRYQPMQVMEFADLPFWQIGP